MLDCSEPLYRSNRSLRSTITNSRSITPSTVGPVRQAMHPVSWFSVCPAGNDSCAFVCVVSSWTWITFTSSLVFRHFAHWSLTVVTLLWRQITNTRAVHVITANIVCVIVSDLTYWQISVICTLSEYHIFIVTIRRLSLIASVTWADYRFWRWCTIKINVLLSYSSQG